VSYIPWRDNPDLDGIGVITQGALEQLSEHIDESSSRGLHADNCGCDKGDTCKYWSLHFALCEETLGWLVGQGLLDPNAVVRWLAENER